MKTWLITHAFSLIAGPVIGILVYFAHEQLQKISSWLDKQSAFVKRAVAMVFSMALAALLPLVGIAVPDACSAVGDNIGPCLAAVADTQWLTAAMGTLFALLSHAVVKKISGPSA